MNETLQCPTDVNRLTESRRQSLYPYVEGCNGRGDDMTKPS
jgi:hypothetical protein